MNRLAKKIRSATTVFREHGFKALLIHCSSKLLRATGLNFLILLFLEPRFDIPSGGIRYPIYISQNLNEFNSLLKLARKSNVKNVLEIGTFEGGSATMFRKKLRAEVTTIDLHIPRGLKVAFKLLGIRYIEGNSHYPTTALAASGTYDMLFIDGDHSYEGVRLDYELYSEYVGEGGLIAFHDANSPAFPGVARLWKELEGEKVMISVNDGVGIGVLKKLSLNTSEWFKYYMEEDING